MAPSFYHYLSVPMDENREKQGWGSCRRRWLVAGILAVLIGAVLVTLTIYFAVTANSEASKDQLRAQDECRNTTHLLQRQLTRAQESLLQAETQTNFCNRTVVTLQDSLEKKVSQALEQQARIRELENEVMKLNQELETLRIQKERIQKETCSTVQVNSGGSMMVSSLLVLTVALFLLF
ncbi:bone marrow stromal antigen 2 [Arvicanthis niloticus]|uniref:bone marrow stromal antigen 2 n=1 Tax=Arvicanthis niloticus TaxID=61156 RepID=UPI0014868D8D|nr:bone marrow stromal antigen 2 [Arvicanthis niloticus]